MNNIIGVFVLSLPSQSAWPPYRCLKSFFIMQTLFLSFVCVLGSVTGKWVQLFVNIIILFFFAIILPCHHQKKSEISCKFLLYFETKRISWKTKYHWRCKAITSSSIFARDSFRIKYKYTKDYCSLSGDKDRMWPKLLDTAHLTHLTKTNGTMITTNIDLFLICLFMFSQQLCLCIQTILWEMEKDYISTLRL